MIFQESSESGPVDLIKTIKHAKKAKNPDAIVVFTDKKPEFDTDKVINEWKNYKRCAGDAKMVLACLNECACFEFGRDDMLFMCGWDENSFSHLAHFLM